MNNLFHKFSSYLIRRSFKSCGNYVELSKDSMFAHPEMIEIGNDVYIGPQAYIVARGGLKIENNVIIGPKITIHTSNHRYGDTATMLPYDGHTHLKPVHIKRNTWIGSNVCICPGVTIGEGVVVAMGTVITKDVPDCALIGGNPGRLIKFRDKEKYNELDSAEKHYMRLKAERRVIWQDYV